jgi:protein-tyrosine phosphatase
MIRVLFVCLGNICRSPMADGVFRQMVADAGLDNQIEVDSAGTGRWHIGETAHRGTLAVLEKHGIDYNGRSRQFKAGDFDRFDYILAMDRSNLSDIQRMANTTNAHIALFLSYANRAGLTDVSEVPDPYYDNRFDYVYDLVEMGAKALLAKIRQDHNL